MTTPFWKTSASETRDATDEEVSPRCPALPTAMSSPRSCRISGTATLGKMAASCPEGKDRESPLHGHFSRMPPLFLLDEATASLDVENETLIQTALSRADPEQGPSLVIAHRMRTVAGADKIVVLDGGRAAEEGDARGADEERWNLCPYGEDPEREPGVDARLTKGRIYHPFPCVKPPFSSYNRGRKLFAE